jgi:hypothetical protein
MRGKAWRVGRFRTTPFFAPTRYIMLQLCVEQFLIYQNYIFCSIQSCSPMKVSGNFGETYCLQLQGKKKGQSKSKRETIPVTDHLI